MKIESRSYVLNGFTPLLGSQPADPEVRTTWLAGKAPTPDMAESEAQMLPPEDNGYQVFLRDSGGLILMDYVLVGFFKSAVKALEAENGIKNIVSKIGTYVFVEPRVIPILRGGLQISAPDRILERPLRAQTMQGPRTTLAASELVDPDWSLGITVKLLANAGTPKSKSVTWDALEEALDYGRLKGLGQWRNGGYGRFTWRRIDQ